MEEKYTLDMLNKDSVSIRKQQYIVQGGKEYEIGHPWRRAYVNSIRGRKEIENDLGDEQNMRYIVAIYAVWGDTPTVIEESI